MTRDLKGIPTILPIAGGKGGVGKSCFTSCLARHIARTGAVCTAVDLDLGGSNLHSFFGLDNVHAGVGDYLVNKDKTLDAFRVAVPGVSNLSFIPGDGLRPFLANLSHFHKMRLLRDLTRINADVVLLDLGAGSSYNTLDFFRVWGRGLLMTTPEHTAIMNMMNFVKNVVLRILAKGCHGNSYMEEISNRAIQQPMQEKIKSIPEILTEMETVSVKRTTGIREQLAALQLDLVVNQVRDLSDLRFVGSVQTSLQKRLGIKVNWQGCIADQPQSRIGLHVQGGGGLPSLKGVESIAERITRREVVSSDSLFEEARSLLSK